jgi:YhcH/YjgK/YiaL family protein
MVFDSISNRQIYRRIGSGIERALDYLANTDFAALEDGKHEIDGDELFALVSTYHTEPESVRSFEAHRKYLDVQYILSGREIIYWAPLAELTPAGEYSEEKDIVFLSGEARARLQLTPGSFTLFYPEDAHMPNCAWNDPGPVRKTVVKVRIG